MKLVIAALLIGHYAVSLELTPVTHLTDYSALTSYQQAALSIEPLLPIARDILSSIAPTLSSSIIIKMEKEIPLLFYGYYLRIVGESFLSIAQERKEQRKYIDNVALIPAALKIIHDYWERAGGINKVVEEIMNLPQESKMVATPVIIYMIHSMVPQLIEQNLNRADRAIKLSKKKKWWKLLSR